MRKFNMKNKQSMPLKHKVQTEGFANNVKLL